MGLTSWRKLGRRQFVAALAAVAVAGARDGDCGASRSRPFSCSGTHCRRSTVFGAAPVGSRCCEQRLAKESVDARVVNASISGETTSGGRSRLEALLKVHRPDVVVIELGANDALRGLPMAMTEDNLLQMTRAAQDAGAKVLLLGMQVPPNYGSAYADRFAATFGNVARQTEATLVPFFLKNVADVPEAVELFQADRIHPNDRAQSILLDNVWPQLDAAARAMTCCRCRAGSRRPRRCARLDAFDAVIDARSESEHALDHLPGAQQLAVTGRRRTRPQVGTLYAQSGAFEAQKVGAALVAANIARHLTEPCRPTCRKPGARWFTAGAAASAAARSRMCWRRSAFRPR